MPPKNKVTIDTSNGNIRIALAAANGSLANLEGFLQEFETAETFHADSIRRLLAPVIDAQRFLLSLFTPE